MIRECNKCSHSICRIKCKCGGEYCHRHISDHDCKFDYKNEQKIILAKRLEKIETDPYNLKD